MLPIHLALVSTTAAVPFRDVAQVSAALQKQIARDFAPLWNVDATIDPFADLDDVPVDYWKILVVDTFTDGGQHRVRHEQPYALVAAGRSWSLHASHEVLEMLADPFGKWLVAGTSPVAGQGRVEYLVEVCDPCQSEQFGYTVNGVLVSDFYTRQYFDPVSGPGVRYSFTGGITSPRQVLKGGYLTWHDSASDNWYQQQYVDQLRIKNLGPIAPENGSIRLAVDRLTPETRALANLAADNPAFVRAMRLRDEAQAAARAAGESLKRLLAADRDHEA